MLQARWEAGRVFLSWRLRRALHWIGRLAASPGARPCPPAHLLAFCPGGLGDALMFLPALRTIRAALSQTRVTLVAAPAVLQLMGELVHHVDPWRRGLGLGQLWRLGRRTRGDGGVDVFLGSVQAVHGVDALVLALACGASTRVSVLYPGEPYQPPGGLWTSALEIREDTHDVIQNLSLLSALGVSEAAWVQGGELAVGAEEARQARDRLAAQGIDERLPLLGLHPGGDPMLAHKRWPAGSFIEVARAIRAARGAGILVFEGPDEPGLGATIAAGIGPGALLIRETAIRGVASLIALCRVFLSSDSGLGHLASALGTPAVTVMGPANPRRVAPWRHRHLVVHAGLPCSPCVGGLSCPGRVKRCVEAIEADRVRAVIEAAWGDAAP
ncbi:MAG: glycosyltransferase family 9 protein [Candidatus Riflebacteria bacterium]|nr:glycosyltransferase family 9 protein [Candidatus Riflebacteria bacterium]